MPLSQDAIEQLKTAYYEAYGKLLSDEDAWSLGYRLLEGASGAKRRRERQ